MCPQSTPVSSSYLFPLVAAYNTLGFVLQNPVGALANRSAIRRPLTPAIFEAKKDNLPAALPQAAMAVASYKQHEFDHFPPVFDLPDLFCEVASRQANSWAFFVYKGREICIADQISLGANLENLSLVLGLLKDLVCLDSSSYTPSITPISYRLRTLSFTTQNTFHIDRHFCYSFR